MSHLVKCPDLPSGCSKVGSTVDTQPAKLSLKGGGGLT